MPWSTIGTALGDAFAWLPVSIALDPVGAIPHYSRLKTFDLWGLNEKNMTEKRRPVDESYRRPGHRTYMSYDHLVEKGATFLIAHPTLLRREILKDPRALRSVAQQWSCRLFIFGNPPPRNPKPPSSTTVLYLPVDARYLLLLMYVTPSPEVDARIRERRWEILRSLPCGGH